jgi:hypothetical protein
MYADVVVAGSPAASAPVVPRSAIQNVGDRIVVYLANPKRPGTYTEREVRVGDASGEQVEVTAGVQSGDVIVTEGSFFVRAERERLGLRPATTAASGFPPGAPASSETGTDSIRSARIAVNEQGFEPATVALRAGARARLTFIRTTDRTCGTEVVFPSLNIKRALPLNEPVVIEFTPAKAEEVAFVCGMNMLRGVVVVQ